MSHEHAQRAAVFPPATATQSVCPNLVAADREGESGTHSSKLFEEQARAHSRPPLSRASPSQPAPSFHAQPPSSMYCSHTVPERTATTLPGTDATSAHTAARFPLRLIPAPLPTFLLRNLELSTPPFLRQSFPPPSTFNTYSICPCICSVQYSLPLVFTPATNRNADLFYLPATCNLITHAPALSCPPCKLHSRD